MTSIKKSGEAVGAPSNVELSQIQLSGQRAANMADTIAQQSALSVAAGAPGS